MKEKDRAAKK